MKSSPSFRETVDCFINEASESSMEALIKAARSASFTDDEVAHLAESCALAGGVAWERMDSAADVASTGGPASLSTLLCPLFLRSFGHTVPKLGIPGRPAGGIDVLAQIPGFKFGLTSQEALAVLNRTGYVHFLADEVAGEPDAVLFAYRRKANALSVPTLVIASLLAKKLALGLRKIGLDVRVAPFGNFGRTWDEARNNALRFCRVSAKLGISSICFLTDGSSPYQPYIGRGESLLALADVFNESACGQLESHVDLCYAIARAVSDTDAQRPTPEALKHHFEQNVTAQGGDIGGYWDKVRSISEDHEFTLTAATDGFLSVDVDALRKTLVASQALFVSSEIRFPDPLGVILRSRQGQYVTKGGAVATVRAESDLWSRTQSELTAAFKILPSPIRTGYFEEVKNA